MKVRVVGKGRGRVPRGWWEEMSLKRFVIKFQGTSEPSETP